MKIALIFHGIYPDVIAGGETAISQMAKYLALFGHSVNVIITMRKTGLPCQEYRDGYNLWRFRSINIPRLRLLSQLFGVARVIHKTEPDIIFGLGVSPGGILASLLGKLMDIRSITMVQGRDLSHGSKAFSRFTLKWSDKVLALTTDAANKLSKIIHRSVQVIPYGIELNRIDSIDKPSRNDMNLSNSDKILLYVGRISREKGLKYLITALTEIIKKIPDIKLVICGEEEGIAPNKKEILDLIEKLRLESYVIFTGRVSFETVIKYMKTADVLVLPSLEEDFGLVNLQAMAAGVPIVASRIGGIVNIIKDGVNGLLTEPGNPTSIVNKVTELIEDSKLRKGIRQNGLGYSRNYSWETVIKRYEQVCLEMTSDK